MKQILKGSVLATSATLLATIYTYSACAMLDVDGFYKKQLAAQVAAQLAVLAEEEKKAATLKEKESEALLLFASMDKRGMKRFADIFRQDLLAKKKDSYLFRSKLPQEADSYSSEAKEKFLKEICLLKEICQSGQSENFGTFYKMFITLLNHEVGLETRSTLRKFDKAIELEGCANSSIFSSFREDLIKWSKEDSDPNIKELADLLEQVDDNNPFLMVLEVCELVQPDKCLPYIDKCLRKCLSLYLGRVEEEFIKDKDREEDWTKVGEATDLYEVLAHLQQEAASYLLSPKKFAGSIGLKDSGGVNQKLDKIATNLKERAKDPKNFKKKSEEFKENYMRESGEAFGFAFKSLDFLKGIYLSKKDQEKKGDVQEVRKKMSEEFGVRTPEELKTLIDKKTKPFLDLTNSKKRRAVLNEVLSLMGNFADLLTRAKKALENPLKEAPLEGNNNE